MFLFKIILVSPTPTLLSACHWKTVELGVHHNLGKKSRKRACRWEPTLQKAAKKYRLDPDLLGALIIVESAWLPWVVSSANACGLTQVIPKWTGGPASGRRKWTCKQLKRPSISIPVGARILRWWLDYHTQKIESSEKKKRVNKKKTKPLSTSEKKSVALREALCGYNAGFRGCKRAGARYAKKVLKLQRLLKRGRLYAEPPESASRETKVSPGVNN